MRSRRPFAELSEISEAVGTLGAEVDELEVLIAKLTEVFAAVAEATTEPDVATAEATKLREAEKKLAMYEQAWQEKSEDVETLRAAIDELEASLAVLAEEIAVLAEALDGLHQRPLALGQQPPQPRLGGEQPLEEPLARRDEGAAELPLDLAGGGGDLQ